MYEDYKNLSEIKKELQEACKYANPSDGRYCICEYKTKYPEHSHEITAEAKRKGFKPKNSITSICDFPGNQKECSRYEGKG